MRPPPNDTLSACLCSCLEFWLSGICCPLSPDSLTRCWHQSGLMALQHKSCRPLLRIAWRSFPVRMGRKEGHAHSELRLFEQRYIDPTEEPTLFWVARSWLPRQTSDLEARLRRSMFPEPSGCFWMRNVSTLVDFSKIETPLYQTMNKRPITLWSEYTKYKFRLLLRTTFQIVTRWSSSSSWHTFPLTKDSWTFGSGITTWSWRKQQRTTTWIVSSVIVISQGNGPLRDKRLAWVVASVKLF